MEPDQAALLDRIERFDLGEGGAGQGSGAFVRRLARENGWPLGYARRVSREYKRFAFLATVAGHPCTPSDQVDQAWHLHLIDTRAYWERFCGQVLGAPLHHVPTRGGRVAHAKFRAWYARTLESYRALFGREPPADIWPAVSERFKGSFVRVDRRRAWVVTSPSWPAALAWMRGLRARLREMPRASFGGLALAALAVTGCAAIHELPPFDLPGSHFLGLFVVLWVAGVAAAAVVRAAHRLSTKSAAWSEPALDPYETAYLAGGGDRVVDAVIASLVHKNAACVDVNMRRLFAGNRRPDLDFIEHAAYSCCERGVHGSASPAELRSALAQEVRALEARLERSGLIYSRGQIRRWLLPALLAPAIGLVKLGVGIAFDKPVGYLIALLLVSTLLSLCWFGAPVQRTVRGSALLERLKKDAPQLSPESPDRPRSRDADVALAVALVGAEVLTDTELGHTAVLLSSASSAGRAIAAAGDGDGDGGDGCGGCGGCGG